MKNEIYTHMGACPYCGQVQQVELPIQYPTVEALEAAALMHCRCPQAERERENDRKLREAASILDEMFQGDENKKLREILHGSVELLLNEQIAGMTVTISYGKSVKVREKSGNVRITLCERAEASEEII